MRPLRKSLRRSILALTVIAGFLLTSFFTVKGATKIRSKSVELTASAVTLEVGNIAALSAVMKPVNSTDKLTWSSSDENVASVNRYGTVTAAAPGEATITVTTSSRKTASCTVTVKKELTAQEVAALINGDFLTEDDVKRLISENTLSEEEIKALLGETGEWTGSKEVPVISGQSFPMLVSDPDGTGIIGNITGLTVRKTHATTSFVHDNRSSFLPYRYDIVLTGEVLSIKEEQKGKYVSDITLGSPDKSANIAGHCEITSCALAGTGLTEIITIYSAYDIDEYFIESVVWKQK